MAHLPKSLQHTTWNKYNLSTLRSAICLSHVHQYIIEVEEFSLSRKFLFPRILKRSNDFGFLNIPPPFIFLLVHLCIASTLFIKEHPKFIDCCTITFFFLNITNDLQIEHSEGCRNISKTMSYIHKIPNLTIY